MDIPYWGLSFNSLYQVRGHSSPLMLGSVCVWGRIPSISTHPSKTNFLCDFSSLVTFLTSAYSLQAVLNHDLSKPHRSACTSHRNGTMCYLLDQKAHVSISFHLPACSSFCLKCDARTPRPAGQQNSVQVSSYPTLANSLSGLDLLEDRKEPHV